jgi:cytochrome c553
MLTQYKNGETRGAQSALMWGQAAALTTQDMENLQAYIGTFE